MERLTDRDFDGARLAGDGTKAVAFVADWCGFCRMFLDDWERAASTLPVDAAIADVTDYGSALWDEFHIDVVPTIVLFRDGQPVWRRDGKLMRGLNKRDIQALKEAASGAATPA